MSDDVDCVQANPALVMGSDEPPVGVTVHVYAVYEPVPPVADAVIESGWPTSIVTLLEPTGWPLTVADKGDRDGPGFTCKVNVLFTVYELPTA